MVAITTALLARTVEERGAGRTFVVGNSAGAGLGLAAAQTLAAEDGPRPAGLILISPWLDGSMSHPDLPGLEAVDPFHRAAGLAEIGRLYADGLSVRDPRVSPLFGPMTGLAPLTVFSGTRELFLTDARTLADRAEAAGIPIDYHEAPGLPHNYALFPTPEGRAARAVILAACRAPLPAGQPH
ncbi:alpha/beta hydrolase fold domain-containing protein [Nocardia sp. NPDC057668]|uniref:alpha/beta hydrolase fold domain-containing protein n=1 Tax=Nocardia sp. NPDC057668 TaxID=3346202 RepID=UPI00366F3A2E